MRHLFFLLITLLSGAALDAMPTSFEILGPVKQVPPQCADPTYACQDLEHARQCSVVKSCINDVWATMSAPEDNDDICDVCKEMVKEARDQLLSNMTQEELKEVFEGSCKLLPVKLIANACIKLVDEFIPDLVEMLASRMDPNMVCTVAGLCNMAHLPSVVCPKLGMCPSTLRRVGIVVQKANVSSVAIDECAICTTVVDYIDKLLEEDDVDKEITQLVEKVCNILPTSVEDKCSAVIETYGPYILQMIGQVADSKQVCQDIDLCSRPSGHVHLVGGNKCTFGPSYWCHSKAHAAACKAEVYCTQKVWKD